MAKSAPKPFTPAQERFGTTVIGLMSGLNVWLYRLTGGWLGGRFPGGAPVCLITVRGRKSGQARTVPLLYLERGADLVVVASKGGMSHHPAWYHNMMANPQVDVEIGRNRRPMVVRRASAEEKAAVWPALVRMYPSYDDYQARTTRDIPVLIVSPA